nr:YqiJ family protein [Pontixanthobacter sp. CEM42]
MPFAVALGIMILLAAAQVLGVSDLLDGTDADVDIDVDMDVDLDADVSSVGAVDGLMSMIGLGRVPFTIWLASFLFIFAGIGVSTQLFAENLTGSPLYVWLAALISGGAALPVNGIVARPLGAILPQDETTAVSVKTLVGRRAEVLDGTARVGSPARARVRDYHGQAHNVMVEPHNEKEEIQAGETVLLVRREGATFYASRLEEPRLAPTQ